MRISRPLHAPPSRHGGVRIRRGAARPGMSVSGAGRAERGARWFYATFAVTVVSTVFIALE